MHYVYNENIRPKEKLKLHTYVCYIINITQNIRVRVIRYSIP